MVVAVARDAFCERDPTTNVDAHGATTSPLLGIELSKEPDLGVSKLSTGSRNAYEPSQPRKHWIQVSECISTKRHFFAEFS